MQRGYGAPERVLREAEIEPPPVGDDDVLVRVRATSVYTPDWIAVTGVPYVLRLRSGLRGLMKKHDLIGDVRGVGLMIGVELVTDRKAKTPATKETKRVLNLMRDHGVLVGYEGRDVNIVKVRPPMPFKIEHADQTVDAMDKALKVI